jgi:hypothetical protein
VHERPGALTASFAGAYTGPDGRLAQLVRAPRRHRGGHRFESCTAHHLVTSPWPDRDSTVTPYLRTLTSFIPLLTAALLLIACGGDAASTSTPSAGFGSGLITSSEFVVGANRFPFVVITVDGQTVDGAAIRVRFSRLVDGEFIAGPSASAGWHVIENATPHLHDDGSTHVHLDFRGVYVVDQVTFDVPGIWVAEFDAIRNGAPGSGAIGVNLASFDVHAQSTAPGIGERVPATQNLTINDAPFSALSSRAVESDELHNASVAQALAAGEPFVVLFSSPQFCVSAMCGPVADTMASAHASLDGAVEFIHIEPWDLVVAREEGVFTPAPVMAEWGLVTEPWTFVVGADGRVVRRYEGLVAEDEILNALQAHR